MLPEHGKALVIEAIVEPGNAPATVKAIDLTMLVGPGGQDGPRRNEQLFAASGLRLSRIVPTRTDACVIEAVPA